MNSLERHVFFPVMEAIQVDFSDGLECNPPAEVTVHTTGLAKAVYVNRSKPTAKHDIILPANTPTAIQCKHTLFWPTASQLRTQLEGTHTLLWFAPGFDEDASTLPVAFQDKCVVSKLQKGQLAFLSGAGCVSHFTIDFLLIMKGLLQQQHCVMLAW